MEEVLEQGNVQCRYFRLISKLIDIDEDLAAMYLTDKKNGQLRSSNDHEELEVLLESFSKQVEEFVNEADTISVSLFYCLVAIINNFALQSNVQSTQEIVELILDSNRNALLALDLQVSVYQFSECSECTTDVRIRSLLQRSA